MKTFTVELRDRRVTFDLEEAMVIIFEKPYTNGRVTTVSLNDLLAEVRRAASIPRPMRTVKPNNHE